MKREKKVFRTFRRRVLLFGALAVFVLTSAACSGGEYEALHLYEAKIKEGMEAGIANNDAEQRRCFAEAARIARDGGFTDLEVSALLINADTYFGRDNREAERMILEAKAICEEKRCSDNQRSSVDEALFQLHVSR